MKKKYLFILTIIMIVFLSSCTSDNVYYGGLSGKVSDADSSNAVSGVQVYVYTSEGDWTSAYKRWEEKGGIYSDEGCLYRASTTADGKWSVPKIIWLSKNGAWGNDYDHIPVWITYFSEEYGCWQEEEKIELVSRSSNTNAVESKKERVRQTTRVDINFCDEKNRNVNDEITFTYTYYDGYRDREIKTSTENGKISLTVPYVKGRDVVLTIKDINAPNECWKYSGEKIVLTLDGTASISKTIVMERTGYDLGEGISGRVSASRKVVLDDKASVAHSLDSLIVEAVIDENTYRVYTGNADYSGENAYFFSSSFSSLASNIKVSTSGKVEFRVYEKKGEEETRLLIQNDILDLSENYEGKNRVNIMINNSWAE